MFSQYVRLSLAYEDMVGKEKADLYETQELIADVFKILGLDVYWDGYLLSASSKGLYAKDMELVILNRCLIEMGYQLVFFRVHEDTHQFLLKDREGVASEIEHVQEMLLPEVQTFNTLESFKGFHAVEGTNGINRVTVCGSTIKFEPVNVDYVPENFKWDRRYINSIAKRANCRIIETKRDNYSILKIIPKSIFPKEVLIEMKKGD